MRILVIIISLSILSCAQHEEIMYKASAGFPLSVSMVQVLTNPNKYENKHIELHGYLSKRPSFSLYLSKNHAEISDHASSVSVTNPDFKDSALSEYCGGNYAVVQGDFKYVQNDPKYSGYWEVVNLARIMVFQDGKLSTCWRKET